VFGAYLKRAAGRFLNLQTLTVSEKNAISISRISKEGERIVFISSYPRSGNTWIRHILSDYFVQNMGFNTTTKLPIHPDKIVPDIYCNMIDERDTSITTPGLFVKTHDSFDTALGLLITSAHREMRHIYIYRQPEDTLVSHYHFHRRYPHLISKTNGGIDAFCLACVDDWSFNVESYVKAKDMYSDCIFFVSYEYMLSNPGAMLMSMFSWLNIPVEDAMLQRAISNMSFNNLRANEEKNPIHKEEFFFRKGMSGSGRQELQASTLDTIITKTSELLRKAKTIVTEQGATPD